MSETRNQLLSKVRKITEALPDRTPLPDTREVAALKSRLVPNANDEATLAATFAKRWKEASGLLLESVADLKTFLKAENVGDGYIDPSVLPMLGIEELAGARTEYDRARVDAIQFGITRASLGVAETGTVVLKDRVTSNRLAALAPWVHIAVLKKSEIVATLGDAVAQFGDDPSIVFVTGPSKTADIEGILIEGVHGPGRQAVLLV
ncbi:LUD domain-containing protein [Pelagicoccus sp. SDUM812003]|uniref:LutC/YkgG family protein n=1 Tax=Pelagicoccus sp. SDUM812003 TaxID=3041267 RepID=UPI00280C498E|nr:LUD domain-containing protein [Pelagicoccus sp. SDUM812003]MDQ8204630.1 LUD domain-containing protein [Pelagicoccus sp. SDUM812003]